MNPEQLANWAAELEDYLETVGRDLHAIAIQARQIQSKLQPVKIPDGYEGTD